MIVRTGSTAKPNHHSRIHDKLIITCLCSLHGACGGGWSSTIDGNGYWCHLVANKQNNILTTVARGTYTGKSPIRIRTYTGGELKLVGEAVVKVCYEKQEEILDLLVVEGSGRSLIGRDWLSKILLNWMEIHKIHTKQASLEEMCADHISLVSPKWLCC